MSDKGWVVRLAKRPVGTPTPDCFDIDEEEVTPPGDNEVVIRNHFLSVDPYMRGRMSDAKSYVAPYGLGEILEGQAVGVVEESRSPQVPVGTAVTHGWGWRDWTTAPASQVRAVNPEHGPLSAFLGPLGTPGLTAYVGIIDVADVRPGDHVYVSGAAGRSGASPARSPGCGARDGWWAAPDPGRRSPI
jgi:NADPH-dependent curcumin reductase CurA